MSASGFEVLGARSSLEGTNDARRPVAPCRDLPWFPTAQKRPLAARCELRRDSPECRADGAPKKATAVVGSERMANRAGSVDWGRTSIILGGMQRST
jgi:hypothetical protein